MALQKLLFPDEAMDKDDVRWLLDYAIEGRRRVKEQLKIMAGVEFIDVNLGYMDADNPQDVHVVRVPEQSEGHPDSRRTAAVRPRVWRGQVAGRRGCRVQAGEQGRCRRVQV